MIAKVIRGVQFFEAYLHNYGGERYFHEFNEEGELDNCERCLGLKGGAKGNENRVDGRVLCDYCTYATQHAAMPFDLFCHVCNRPLGEHKVLTLKEFHNALDGKTISSICEYEKDVEGPIVVWLRDTVEDPCDEDFMLEIST